MKRSLHRLPLKACQFIWHEQGSVRALQQAPPQPPV
jgi:hypothetical protein